MVSGLRSALSVAMLSLLASRSLFQAAAELRRSSFPTAASLSRTLSASSPACGAASVRDSVVSYLQLKSMLASGDLQLFDVRTPEEFQAGRIPTAVNTPLDTLEETLQLSPDRFQQRFQVRPPGKDDGNIVFHCRSGKRSAAALDIALRLGFSRARHFKGGYMEWEEQEGQ